ncbi:MAG: UDP-N-acetylglucosamine 2-epimerase [Alphaproteobacteria bacterium]
MSEETYRRRRVCTVTGTRADYGLLRWAMAEIDADPRLELCVIATAMHLLPEFGGSIRAIEADGFTVDATVDMLLAGDSPLAMAKSTGLGTIGLADALARLQPDWVLVPGDRIEALAAAQAAMLLGIPVAHLHGGEISLGAVDDSIRHAITKMAVLHLTAAEPYRRRVVQLGEAPERVIDVGAPGLEALTRLPLLDRTELERSVGHALPAPLLLVTFHPETRGGDDAAAAVACVIDAALQVEGTHLLVTRANADAGGRAINARLDAMAAREPARIALVASLGQQRYLSALALADAVVGNSSSGLIEAPAAGTPTVNIGGRQDGRLRAPSVIDCPLESAAISAAIRRALGAAMQACAARRENPYGAPGPIGRRIAEALARAEPPPGGRKPFHDIVVPDLRDPCIPGNP